MPVRLVAFPPDAVSQWTSPPNSGQSVEQIQRLQAHVRSAPPCGWIFSVSFRYRSGEISDRSRRVAEPGVGLSKGLRPAAQSDECASLRRCAGSSRRASRFASTGLPVSASPCPVPSGWKPWATTAGAGTVAVLSAAGDTGGQQRASNEPAERRHRRTHERTSLSLRRIVFCQSRPNRPKCHPHDVTSALCRTVAQIC